MRPIKFRGKAIKTGKFVYGGIFQNGNQFMIINVHFNEEGYPYPDFIDVEPDSIKQLLGYDKNGREVYDGDALQTEKDGTIYAAVLRHAKIAPCDDMAFSEMAKRCGWTVKEAEENDI